jgi:hypothetical protein
MGESWLFNPPSRQCDFPHKQRSSEVAASDLSLFCLSFGLNVIQMFYSWNILSAFHETCFELIQIKDYRDFFTCIFV